MHTKQIFLLFICIIYHSYGYCEDSLNRAFADGCEISMIAGQENIIREYILKIHDIHYHSSSIINITMPVSLISTYVSTFYDMYSNTFCYICTNNWQGLIIYTNPLCQVNSTVNIYFCEFLDIIFSSVGSYLFRNNLSEYQQHRENISNIIVAKFNQWRCATNISLNYYKNTLHNKYHDSISHENYNHTHRCNVMESILNANITTNLTISPTSIPTLNPTSIPTLGPTLIPTLIPTLSPTLQELIRHKRIIYRRKRRRHKYNRRT